METQRAPVASVAHWGDGTDAALVLHPGFGRTPAAQFEFLGPMLGRSRPVVAAEQSGSGDLDAQAERFADSATTAGSVPHLAGIGYGAAVAVRALARGLVGARTLTLIAPIVRAGRSQTDLVTVWRSLTEAEAEAGAARTEPAGAGAPHEAVAAAIRHAFLGTEFLDRRAGAVLTDLDLARAADQLAQLVGADLTPDYAAVAVPTLVVACTDDVVAGPAQARLAFGAVPDARLARIDSGHEVTTERPAELLSILEAFLREPHAHPAGTRFRAEGA